MPTKKAYDANTANRDSRKIISNADTKAAEMVSVKAVDGETGKRKLMRGDNVLHTNVIRSSRNQLDGGKRKMVKVESAKKRPSYGK